LISEGRLETAYTIFSTIIDSVPDWAEGWNKRATVLYLMGRYQDSLSDIDEVLKRESRHFGALSGQGLVLIKLENYEKAIKSYQAAQKIYPSIKTAKISVSADSKLSMDFASSDMWIFCTRPKTMIELLPPTIDPSRILSNHSQPKP